jgi:alcohol dehydrogenase
MNDFEFNLPTRVVFGNGVLGRIGDEIRALGKTKVLIVTDPGLIKAGLLDKLTGALDASGIEGYAVFSEVQPNPRDTGVQKAYDLAVREGTDVLIAFGGGSPMDTAKGVALLLTHGGGRINDYEDPEKIVRPAAPVIAVPTTVGTGSEVTFWAVITDTERRFKMGIGSPLIAPVTALLDPDLIETLPEHIIASTGVDALTHAIEGYTCRIAEPVSDAMGLYAIELISRNLRKATYAEDPEARSSMLVASMIAGISFGQTDVAAVHCMAEALGSVYDIPHGVANACILPYVMEYNLVADLEKFARIAVAMGENTAGLTLREAALKSVEAVKTLNRDLRIPTLKETGFRIEDVDLLAEKTIISVSMPDNPRAMTKDDVIALFHRAYDGA